MLRLVPVIFPLGLSFLVLLPLGVRPIGKPTFQDYVGYVAGARYGILASVPVVAPVAIVWSIVYHQSVVGNALMVTTIGSLLLPSVSLSGVQAYLVAKGGNSDWLFDKARLSPTNSESVAILLLGLFQRIPHFLRSMKRTAQAQLIFTVLYFLSWIILSLAGGFPYTMVGLVLGVLIPLSAYLSFRRFLTSQERTKLSEILVAGTRLLPQTKSSQAP